MKPFNILKSWHYPNISHWQPEILNSLIQINKLYHQNRGTILDVGGGKAPFSLLVNISDYTYILVDPNVDSLKAAPNFIDKRKGYGEKLPIESDSIDIIITSSCLQYINQEEFFKECRRTLKAGGLIAVHENGPLNPIILFARLTQRLIGLVNRKHWHYRNTIKQYFVPKEIDGFTIKYKSETGLITPILLCLQYFNIKEPKLLSDFLSRTDEVLLDRMSFLKRYTFLKIVIYKKNN